MKVSTGVYYRRKLQHLTDKQLDALKDLVRRKYEANFKKLSRVGPKHETYVAIEKRLESVSQAIVREKQKRRAKR
jgi:hypothetical protein